MEFWYLVYFLCNVVFNFSYMNLNYGNITNRSIHPIRPSPVNHVTGSANTRVRAGYGSRRFSDECGTTGSVNVLIRDYEI